MSETEINEELQFIPANGKHAIAKIASFYTAAGISIKAIADFDLINDRERLKEVLHAISGQNPSTHVLDTAKELHDAARNFADFKSSEDDSQKRKEHLKEQFKQPRKSEAFNRELLAKADIAIDECLSEGLLILRDGELEASLEPDVAYSHTKSWPNKALSYLSRCNPDELLNAHAVARDLLRFLKRED